MTSTTPDGSGGAEPVAGRYELHDVLGRGGDSVVHRGWDRRLRRAVALKLVPTRDAGTAAGREARLLADLHHDRLVTLLDVVVEPYRVVLVMDLILGGTLQGAIADGPLGPAEVASIAGDLADALAYTHARGVVHRDVKPANVLLSAPVADGGPRAAHLADFGIARLLGTDTTRSADLVGTARYVSPEQARGQQVGPPTDVYSLGLTLLEALSGRTAFPGDTAESLTARLLRDPEVPRSIGRPWRALLAEMTRRDPAARPTAAEVVARVRAMPTGAAESGGDPTATMPIAAITAPFEVPVVGAPPRVRRRGAALAGAAAAGLLLVAGGALAALSSPAAPAPAAAAAAVAASAPARVASTGPSPSGTPDPEPSTAGRREITAVAVVDRRIASPSTVPRRAGGASSRSPAHHRKASTPREAPHRSAPAGPSKAGGGPAAPHRAPGAPAGPRPGGAPGGGLGHGGPKGGPARP